MLNPYDLNHADFTGVPAVGTGAGFDITCDFHYTNILPRGNTPLVKGKTIFLLGFCTVLNRDLNRLACHDHPVCLSLNFTEFVRGDMFEVPDINTGTFTSFLSSCLVNMHSKDLFCGMEENMRSGMMTHQGPTPLLIHHSFYPFTTAKYASRNVVEYNFPDLY